MQPLTQSSPGSRHSRAAHMQSMRGRCAVTLIALLATSPTLAEPEAGNGWHYKLAPYLWLPTIGGDLRYEAPPDSGTGAPTVEVGPTDWLDLLNFAALVGGSAQKGRVSLFADVVYLSMSSANDDRVVSVEDSISVPGTPISIPVGAELNADTRTDLDGLQLTLTAGYVVWQEGASQATVFAGARYFDVEVSTSWDLTAEITLPGGSVILPSSGSIGGGATLWDAVVGVRGELEIGQGNWSLPYYLDVGTGDSDVTWNAFLGGARKFGWGELLIAWRHLEYDQNADDLLQNFSFSGPLIGARFSF